MFTSPKQGILAGSVCMVVLMLPWITAFFIYISAGNDVLDPPTALDIVLIGVAVVVSAFFGYGFYKNSRLSIIIFSLLAGVTFVLSVFSIYQLINFR
jgi:hypothetical protein